MKCFGVRSMTSKGPSYGFWRGVLLASCLMNTNFACLREFGTWDWILSSPWAVVGTGHRFPTRSRCCCSSRGADLGVLSGKKSPGTVSGEP